MATFAVKLLLAPAFVAVASLAARRWGPRIGGWIAGLPIVAGPVLLVYGLEHGDAFAARAALGTLLGLISLCAFTLAYGHLALRFRWPTALGLSWLAFLASTVALRFVSVSPPVALVLVIAAIAATWVALPESKPSEAPLARPPSWDLPLRLGSAAGLVLVLSAISGMLGPRLSGLLAPFPIATAVLAAFTHAQSGDAAAVRVLHGLVLGLVSFALFCFVVAETARELGLAASFGLGSVIALTSHGVMLVLMERTRLARAVS